MLGVVHEWRHGLGKRGYQGFCDDSTKALELKSVTMEEGVSKNIKYCVTSYMDDSLSAAPLLLSILVPYTKLKWTGFVEIIEWYQSDYDLL